MLYEAGCIPGCREVSAEAYASLIDGYAPNCAMPRFLYASVVARESRDRATEMERAHTRAAARERLVRVAGEGVW